MGFMIHVGTDTLELHDFTEGDIENIVMKFDGKNLNFSLNDAQFLSIERWNDTNFHIETLKTIDESGNEESSYDLSGYTFAADSDVRLADIVQGGDTGGNTEVNEITITGDETALQLTAGNDKATGDDRNNEFKLSQGDTAGDDTLIGGGGDDTYTLAVNQIGTLTITDSWWSPMMSCI